MAGRRVIIRRCEVPVGKTLDPRVRGDDKRFYAIAAINA